MKRRAFLGALLAGAAGLALDPERALWVPGAKRIFLPPVKPVLWSSSELMAGDMFRIVGKYAVNPITGISTGIDQLFTITATVSAGPVNELLVHPPLYVASGTLPSKAIIEPCGAWR